MNYFELYGLVVKPVVNIGDVIKKYAALQRKYHPDFFSQEDEAVKEEAEQMSAAINKGYMVFKDRDKTIAYYLQIKNKLEENEKYELPPGFLMEMMELNENLGEDDNEVMQEKIIAVEKELDDSIAAILEKPAQAISDAELDELKAFHYKKKYVKRVLDRLAD